MAELVFGTPLSLPGQYFSATTDLTPVYAFIQELCQKIANLNYTPSHQCPTDIYIPQRLQKCKFVFVFVRNDTIKWLLTSMYLGLF